MYDQMPWAEFKSKFRWGQGEHLAAMAPTGAGKTTLFSELMQYRGYNLMFGTKRDDKTYEEILRKPGWRRVESIHDIKPWDKNVLLWPQMRRTIPEHVMLQQATFRDALDVVVKQKAWTVWIDEAKYLSEFLKLRNELTYCLEQLRSVNATIICGAQRPAYVSPSVLSNSSHVFLWKTTNRNDLQRLSDVGGIDAKEVSNELKMLGKFEFLYIQTRGTEAKVIRSQVER